MKLFLHCKFTNIISHLATSNRNKVDLLALYLIIDIRSKIFDSNNPNMF